MPKRIVVWLTICLALVGLGVAIAGMRLIVAESALGYVLTLVGFLLLVLAPTLVGRLGGSHEDSKS